MIGKWIGTGCVNNGQNSLPPEIFRKTIYLNAKPVDARLCASAMGIYAAEINGKTVDGCYFAPGYTHYESYVQEQTYCVTDLLQAGENDLRFTVANGWWLGTLGDRNNRYGNHRGLIAKLRLIFADGTEEIIGTDDSWEFTTDGVTRYSDFYCGETIDLTRLDTQWRWFPVCLLTENFPERKPHIGAFVRRDGFLTAKRQGNIYDFGQNHAGVIHLAVKAKKGTVITVRHAEILDRQGHLFTANLRTAKQTLTLVCRDGENVFDPRFTFMGFRYAEIKASGPIEILELWSWVLTSDCKQIGDFACSDPLLNRLYQNICWGQRSNFIDIPTDCPQRDERFGWTGDIAAFAETAALNRDISAFMRKWLYDLRLYQYPNGAIPVTVPQNPTYDADHCGKPIALWGDAAVMVPWAVYRAYGDKEMLSRQYESMKAYAELEIAAAALSGEGKEKYLWNTSDFQYGDWCAPGLDWSGWIARGNDLATVFLYNSVNILRQAARELGKAEDEARYMEMMAKIQDAYETLCIREDGTVAGDFQSAYVCGLYFGLIPNGKRAKVAARLVQLVRENRYRIATGFPGTPYIAFALADNGYVEDAYKLLQNEECPGWLFTVKAGGTTIWERWDAVDETGNIRDPDDAGMVSFNHYAYGAVGAFFYRRILGLEPMEAGYRTFRVKPVIGGTLTYAQGHLDTPHGRIAIRWEKKDGITVAVSVPEGTACQLVLPNGISHSLKPGQNEFWIAEV